MKPEEAIRVIEVAKAECEWNAPLEYQIAFGVAIKALEKQMPKKPIMYYQFPEKLRKVIERTNMELAKSKTECCPVCGRPLGISQFVKKQTGQKFGDPHCKRCGQAIDWGDSYNE